MVHVQYGGAVNNTNGFSGSWPANGGNFVYTDGYTAPVGNINSDGTRVIYIGSIGADYVSGPYTGAQVVIDGVLRGINQDLIFPSAGGSLQLRFTFVNGGTLYYGRNTGNGLRTVRNRDGTVQTGGLCGTMDWATVPTAPAGADIDDLAGAGMRVRWAGPSWNGDSGIDFYRIYLAGPGHGLTYIGDFGGSQTDIAAPWGAGDYSALVFAHNHAGFGQPVSSPTRTVTVGGGRRFDGSSFVTLGTPQRFDGSSWVATGIQRRFDGTNWIDISN